MSKIDVQSQVNKSINQSRSITLHKITLARCLVQYELYTDFDIG